MRCLIFLGITLLFLTMALPSLIYSALPQKEKRAYETLQIPTVGALEDEKKGEDLFQLLKAADVVLQAELNEISVRQIAMAHLNVPITFMTFKEIEAIQGALPPETTFRANQEVTKFPPRRGEPVLVMLNQVKSHSKELEIAKIVKANKRNLSLAKHAASLKK